MVTGLVGGGRSKTRGLVLDLIRGLHPIEVVSSVNGSDAAAIGGAVLVLQSELTLLRLQR